jgi:aminoglycoside phosphotransferase family enzyme/predicted kinase
VTDVDSSHPRASQDEVVAALAVPAFFPHRPAAVEHVQTHISHVFLAGPYVYKLKKAVRFSFLDFGTLERRRWFCDEELRLNRRLAAPVYLDVVPVVRRADGGLALGGDGALVEPVLRMRRLPAERMLPALLATDAVAVTMMERLAHRLVEFHRAAPTGAAVAVHAAPAALQARWDDTLAVLQPFVGRLLPAAEHALLADFGPRFVRTHAALFRARQEEGRIRDGHGDLHAEHVCFVDEPEPGGDAPALAAGIYVFDCIEFSVPFRCNDVASEVAFLAMDLEHRGRRDLADAFIGAYVGAAADPMLTRLLPYYVAARACVRATVACLTSSEDEVAPPERAVAERRAAAYLALAVRAAWRAGDPVVVACCGLSGTGKSTLAAALADRIDAVVLRTDLLRKRDDAGGATAPTARYDAAARVAVYATLCTEVDAALAAGRSVIADATFLRHADRARLVAVAARHGRRCIFMETQASEATVQRRLAARSAADVSDARFDTYLAQRAAAEPFAVDEVHVVVATDDPTRAAADTALRALWTWRIGGDAASA